MGDRSLLKLIEGTTEKENKIKLNGNNYCIQLYLILNCYVKFYIGNIVELYRGLIFSHVRPSYE